MRAKILAWFEDECPFLAGVNIYRQVGGVYRQQHFEGYGNAAWIPEAVENNLQYALREWLEKNPATEEVSDFLPKSVQVPAKHVPPSSPIAAPATEPDAILRLRQEARKLHKRHAEVKARLNVMAGDLETYSEKERYLVCVEIMTEIIPQLDSIYDRIREWKSTGELPAVAKNEIVADTVAKVFRINSLNSRISRLPKLIEKAEDKDKNKLILELKEKELERKELKFELGIE